MKNLIYFTVGCDPEYIQLTRLCLETIARHNSLENIDILIMCDEEYAPYVRATIPYFVKISITEPNSNAMITSMRKTEIFQYPFINEYDKILYLDSDIVVLGDITPLFKEYLEDDILYVKSEKGELDTLFHGLQHYTDEDLARFKVQGQFGFSAGHFLFKNSPTMKKHFRNIQNLITDWKGAYFYEQSFMNHYFMLNRKYNDTLLKDVIEFFDSKPETLVRLVNKDALIVHFVNSQQDHKIKLHNMRYLINNRFNQLEVDFYDTRNAIPHVLNLPQNPKIAEIGVLAGDFSTILLESEPSMLFLIDPYEGDIVSGDADGNNLSKYNGGETYNRLLKKFKDNTNVTVLRTKSDILSIFPDNYFDLVYIDGDHSYDGVKHDLELARTKVKHGGWICGHDIFMNPEKTKNQYDFGVKKAVFDFIWKNCLHVSRYFNDGCVSYAIENIKSLEYLDQFGQVFSSNSRSR